jgi:hypothetical protein
VATLIEARGALVMTVLSGTVLCHEPALFQGVWTRVFRSSTAKTLML